jgi:hypothetical protein
MDGSEASHLVVCCEVRLAGLDGYPPVVAIAVVAGAVVVVIGKSGVGSQPKRHGIPNRRDMSSSSAG